MSPVWRGLGPAAWSVAGAWLERPVLDQFWLEAEHAQTSERCTVQQCRGPRAAMYCVCARAGILILIVVSTSAVTAGPVRERDRDSPSDDAQRICKPVQTLLSWNVY